MTPQAALIELRLRLNKLHSSDYDNIPDWTAMKAINKAAVEWVRRQVQGINQSQAGDEETRMKMDDLQILLKPHKLTGINKDLYFESKVLPEDYLYYKGLMPIVTKGECQKVPLHTTLVEEANVSDYLNDWAMQPSFDWNQTFHTLIGNRIRVYTNSDFHVNEAILTYYRKPKRVDVAGYTREDGTSSTNSDLEFKEDIANIILDDAAAIIAGSTDNYNAQQVTKQRADQNT